MSDTPVAFRQAGPLAEFTLNLAKAMLRTVMIDGYDVGPLALDKVMISGMAELFAPKLLQFFDRRHLLSFSLLTGIGAEEFNAFLVLMSEPPRPGRAEEERDRLTQAFLDQHIVHVSTLFEADVLGRERRLPWRVERALSRLGRDLKMLPLYKVPRARRRLRSRCGSWPLAKPARSLKPHERRRRRFRNGAGESERAVR